MPVLMAKTCSALQCAAVSAFRSMTCYSPYKAFRGVAKHPSGKPVLTFNPIKAINSTNPLTLPCGKCIGCRIDRSRDWAIRCHHEAQMTQFTTGNSFLTLTYDDDNLPEDYSVQKTVAQTFMKSLRHQLYPHKIRFLTCGEYGELTLRPHYHSLIFGYDFRSDRKFYKENANGDRLYTSELLSKCWTFGQALLGDVSYQSAAYVARYVMKKINGDEAARHYLRTHPKTGLTVQVQPEFMLPSMRPGIGSSWFEKYKSDVFPSDFLVVDGKQHPVPRYYLKKLEEEEIKKIKRQRKRASLPHKQNSTPERLAVREVVKTSQILKLKRTL